MSDEDTLFENPVEPPVDRRRVYFAADDAVLGYGLALDEDETLPGGAVRSEDFDHPIIGVDPNLPLWDYRKPADGNWELLDGDACMARDHGALEEYRTAVLRTLVARVNTRNQKAGGGGLGRDPVHDSKVGEAESFQADGTVGIFIQMEIDIKGMVAADVAAGILAKRATEQAAKHANEAIFIAARIAVKDATTHTEIKAAADAVTWPDLSDI